MITIEQLVGAFKRNMRIIQMQTEGLNQADSLLQLPFRANNLNWVVGHILTNRDTVLKLLGEDLLLTEAQSNRYKRESESLTEEGEYVIPLDNMLEILASGQESISTALARFDDDEFSKEIMVGEHKRTLGERLFFLYFHETYHVGQTEILRQLAGKDDKVI